MNSVTPSANLHFISRLDYRTPSAHYAGMDRETIKETLRCAGRFLIRTADGREYRVPHPDFVWFGRLNIVIEGPKGGFSIIDPFQITAIIPVKKRQWAKAA